MSRLKETPALSDIYVFLKKNKKKTWQTLNGFLEPWGDETQLTLRQFNVHVLSGNPNKIDSWFTLAVTRGRLSTLPVSVAQNMSSNCSVRVTLFQTVNSQGRQHPDRPGSEVRAQERFPRRSQLLRCGPDRHPLIRWEVSGQRGAGGCSAQRDGRGPVRRGPPLPQVCSNDTRVFFSVLQCSLFLKLFFFP